MEKRYRWYELKLYSSFNDGTDEILNLLYRVDEFAVFIIRKEGKTRILLMADDANSIHFFNIKNSEVEELEWIPLLKYRYVNCYKSRIHYAIPIVQEVRPTILYDLLEQLNDECVFACYAKYTDKSYDISKWIMKKEHGDNLTMILSSLFKGSNGRKRLSPFMQGIIEKAKWKMRLKHFATVIALASNESNTLHLLESVLPKELIAYKHFKDYNIVEVMNYDVAKNACILSDIELANIVALPKDVSLLRLSTPTRVKTFTNGIVIDRIDDNIDLNLIQ